MRKLIYFLPRILSIVIVGFLALFILEGFDPSFGWQSGLAHAILAIVILAVTIIAWKWPKVGGWIFVVVGLVPTWEVIKSPDSSAFWSQLLIGIVPLLTGVLFLIEGFQKPKK
jgi:uncharacterized membrane protein HdeD (DUF308 family)